MRTKEDFLKKIDTLIPNTFLIDQIEECVEDNCVKIVVPTTKQFFEDELSELLVERTNVKIIYYIKRNKGKEFIEFGCSAPTHDDMFTITIHSVQYGIVDKITFTLYQSIEVMYHYVRHCVASLEVCPGERLESIDEEGIDRIFIL